MLFGDSLRSSIQSILNHKIRSLLTLTGIVIGVMAVVTMFSSVYAIKALIQKNMEGMGWNYSVIIVPSQVRSTQNEKHITYHRVPKNAKNLDYEDYQVLKEQSGAKTVYGMIETEALYKKGAKDYAIRLRATNNEFFTTQNYSVQSGRYFNKYESENLIPVIILGYHFAKEHFGDRDPINSLINLGLNRYRIIGVLEDDNLNSGNGMHFNPWQRMEDLKAVYIPLRFGARYLSQNMQIHYIKIQAASEEEFEPVKDKARQLLLARHQMYPNFMEMDIGAMLLKVSQEIDSTMGKWNITLFAIASISLIVGGIGLFSTLLISIQEKMTEIGIRKSIGASERDIFYYFIFEAVTLAILGALLGVIIAWIALSVMGKALKVPLFLPWEGVVLGTAFAALIGFLSGIYPALKASSIDPIQAIYYHE